MNKGVDGLIAPTQKKERIYELDIIRGFALLGVLLVNMTMINSTMLNNGISPFAHEMLWDKVGAIFIKIFATGKFYTIFSFLFGLGFYIFWERIEEKGLKGSYFFKRRMTTLLVFGILHLIFIWYGDILHTYAIIGFILILFRGKSLKSLKTWIITLFIISTSIMFFAAIIESSVNILIEQGLIDDTVMAANMSMEVYTTGSYVEVVKYRLTKELPVIAFNIIFTTPKILMLFLAGLYVGKKGVFKNISEHLSSIKSLWVKCGILGVASTIVYLLILSEKINIYPVLRASTAIIFEEIATVTICFFYISSIILLLRKKVFVRIFAPLRYVGQMALTNYLTQTIVWTFAFYGYGIGLLGDTGVILCILFTIIFYGLQIVISRCWLSYFNYGPFEWLWRKLTYGRAYNSNILRSKTNEIQ